jgi:formate dehydrogenase iron-sulfur subunit
MASKAILFDSTMCIGCRSCEEACAKQNGLAYDENIAKVEKTSEYKFTSIVTLKGAGGEDKYMRKLCMHCADPTCVSVCPVKALSKSSLGPVTYDASKCMGCRYCMLACPFNVPKYEWSSINPRIRKCIMCPDRVAKGLPTACAEACPTGATMFGDRGALLAEAQQRIRNNPGYMPYIYGLTEAGGTSVLILSSVDIEKFGYPAPSKVGDKPLPYLTADVLKGVPGLVSIGWAVLGGVWWITNRRDIVAAAEQKKEER